MDAKKLGETPAFPCEGDRRLGPWPGMTLRQWYAGLAMQGLLSRGIHPTKYLGEESLRCADALLDELAKEHA